MNPAAIPTRAISSPDLSQLRFVKIVLTHPTKKSAQTVKITDIAATL